MRSKEVREFWGAIETRLDGRRWGWLAARMGMTRAELEGYRRGIPRVVGLRRLAAALGITVGDLLDPPSPPPPL